jgi:hypothetical protein
MTLTQVGTFLLGHAVATLGFYLGTVAIRSRTPPRWMVPGYLRYKDDPDNPPPLSPEAIIITRFLAGWGAIIATSVGLGIVYDVFR